MTKARLQSPLGGRISGQTSDQTFDQTFNQAPGDGEYSYSELVSEMKLLGMDPAPFLEIAASDIISRHGSRGQAYAQLMLDQMIAEDDPDGIYLWNALLSHIYNHISYINPVIH